MFNNKNPIVRVIKRIITILFISILVIIAAYYIILGILFEKISLSSENDYKNSVICDDLEVHYVDVGQGDGTVIFYKDKVIVIDCGSMMHKFKMEKYLKKNGVKRINALIITHPHQDHFGGLDALLCNFKVDKIYTTEINSKVEKSLFERLHLLEYNCIISEYNAMNHFKKIADGKKVIKYGDLKLKFIGPDKVYKNFNNNSIVVKLDYKETSMLFTGDIEAQAELDLVQNHAKELNVDVLKIAHHGSHTSSTEEFLEAVNPQIAVISCAIDNDFWHPHKSVAKRLKDYGIILYRTDEGGTIILHSDGETITTKNTEGSYRCGTTLSSKHNKKHL